MMAGGLESEGAGRGGGGQGCNVVCVSRLIKTFPVANQKGSVTFSGLLCCIGASGPCVALARLDRFL